MSRCQAPMFGGKLKQRKENRHHEKLHTPLNANCREPNVHGPGRGQTARYRANGGEPRRSTVNGMEFVRRFLQHVLPKGFQRVRHYGWRGAAAREKWERILALLDWKSHPAQPSTLNPQPVLCPACGKAMRLIGTLPRSPPGRRRV